MNVGDIVLPGFTYDMTLTPHGRLEKNTKYVIEFVTTGYYSSVKNEEITLVRLLQYPYYYNSKHFMKYE